MQTIKHISIPNPCSQNWQEMEPNQNGRHCANCCKTVTDFTRMSDQQIIEMLSAGGKTCGRFASEQLNSINRKFSTVNLKMAGWWKRIAVAVTVLWSITYFRTPTLGRPLISSHPVKKDAQPDLATVDSVTYITITGVVTAKDDGLPLPGVTISAIGSNAHTTSLANGSFKLQVPLNAKKLRFSFVGFEPAEVGVKKGKDNKYDISMSTSSQWMGEVVIVTSPLSDNTFMRSYGN